ncbi:hypothetical protein BD309DRAFT_962874 [Dichomitus squalens]|uniref:DUF6533 domain-containing protein n=1 Tax=Dichomitus squalens TaxID=114155 RepID=A0A4Q9PWQ2_9APHY|nr:hypothetical protein BD309DRAFT_962874 [Dichomitus squalens]TBU58949.1 hypothetical protein BD310DRAFT_926158 [Dichomitus squalens]
MASSSIDEVVASYAIGLFENYCDVTAPTVVMYDWLLTFPREAQLMLRGRARPLSVALYLANRYINLLDETMGLLGYNTSLSTKSCTGIAFSNLVLTYLSLLPPALFTGLRAFALSSDWRISSLILILSCLPFATNMVTFGYHLSGLEDPILGCLDDIVQPESLFRKIGIINRTCTIAADTLLIVLTWWSLRVQTIGQAAGAISEKGLVGVMLRDGMLYFGILLVLNIAQLLVEELSFFDTLGDIVAVFSAPLSSILVSHFMLDLQEAYQRKVVGLASNDPLHTSHTMSVPSLNFANALGSIATHIDQPKSDLQKPGWEDYEVDEPNSFSPNAQDTFDAENAEAVQKHTVTATEIQQISEGGAAAEV